MHQTTSRARGLAGALLCIALAPDAAHAEGSRDLKEACAASYEQGQTLRRAAKLTLARAQVVVCQETCPAALARDCRRWADEIEREMPGVTISALDRNGATLPGVELSVDGEIRELPAGDLPLRLDPGRHRLVLRHGDERHVREVVLQPRARRALRVSFSVEAASRSGAPDTGSDPTSDRGEPVIPPAAWALGAIGVLGLGTGAVLGIKGHVDRSDLRSRCAPDCEQDEVDAIERDWTIAAVAAGVGAVATGVAIWIVIDENPTRFSLTPAPGGALGAWGGTF